MGVALILQNVATLVWGKSSQYSPPLFSATRDNVIKIMGVGVFVEELLVIAAAFLVVWFVLCVSVSDESWAGHSRHCL